MHVFYLYTYLHVDAYAWTPRSSVLATHDDSCWSVKRIFLLSTAMRTPAHDDSQWFVKRSCGRRYTLPNIFCRIMVSDIRFFNSLERISLRQSESWVWHGMLFVRLLADKAYGRPSPGHPTCNHIQKYHILFPLYLDTHVYMASGLLVMLMLALTLLAWLACKDMLSAFTCGWDRFFLPSGLMLPSLAWHIHTPHLHATLT